MPGWKWGATRTHSLHAAHHFGSPASTGCEWANDAANEVPVAAVHSKAPVRKNAPREKYPVDPYTRAAPARNSRLIGAAQWARDSANSAPRISVTPLTAIPRPVSFPFGLTSASFA